MTSAGSALLNDQTEDCCPLLHFKNGKYGLPRETLSVQGERCLLSSRSDSAADYPDLLAHGINRYTSHTGGIYFKFECFLTPCNVAHPAVLSAFKEAASQIKRCLAAHNVQLSTHEVVIVLQCLSLTQLQFYYYAVDHNRGQIMDTYAHSGGVPGSSCSGPMLSMVEYWRHVASFPAHRLCTQSVYDHAYKLARGLALKSSIEGSGNINPEILEMLNVFEQNKIDMYATFSIAKTMLHIFETSAQECFVGEVRSRPTLLQSFAGFFSDVFGSRDGRFKFECDEYDLDHPLVHDDLLDASRDPNASNSSNFTLAVRQRTGWNDDE